MSRAGQKAGAAKTAIRWIALAIIAICLVITAFVVRDMLSPKEPEVSASYVTEKLEECSQLTTAELTYRGLVNFQDGDIPYLTQKAFQMLYTAEIEAEVDLSRAIVEVDKKQIKFTLPAVEIDDPRIDPNSIEIFDEKFALFNWQDRNDTVEVMKIAEVDAVENGDIDSLKERARDQAKIVIESLLKDVAGSREIVIEFSEQDQ